MKLEIQQVNLDLSKQLKEAGYPQEGLWWWTEWSTGTVDTDISICADSELLRVDGTEYGQFMRICIAPTVAELGERLPRYIELKVIAGQTQTHYLYTTKSFNNEWGVFYAMNNGRTRHHREYADTEADCRAKMWLYLKKRNKK